MDYKEKSKVDVQVSCSNCGSVLVDGADCRQCIDQQVPTADQGQTNDKASLPEDGGDPTPTTAPTSTATSKEKSKIGAGVFFRSRLLLAIMAVTVISAGAVYAFVGEDLPFLWTMATNFTDPDKTPDHFVNKIVNSAGPHNRPFFLLFKALVFERRARLDPNKYSEKEKRHAVEIAAQACREAADIFEQRSDPRFEAVARAACAFFSTTEIPGKWAQARKDMARFADLVTINDPPKSNGPRFSIFFSFGDIEEPYKEFINASRSFSTPEEAGYINTLYERILNAMKGLPDNSEKKNLLTFAYSHSLLMQGEKERAARLRREAINVAIANHLVVPQDQTNDLFSDILAEEAWDDGVDFFKNQPGNKWRLAFCYFADGRNAEGQATIIDFRPSSMTDDRATDRNSPLGFDDDVPKRFAATMAKIYEACILDRHHKQGELSVPCSNDYTARAVLCHVVSGDKSGALALLNRERFFWPRRGENGEVAREYMICKGSLYLACGDAKTARAIFETLRQHEVDPSYSELYIAVCDARVGKVDLALQEFDRIASHASFASWAELAKANLLLKVGSNGEAEVLLKRLAIPPAHATDSSAAVNTASSITMQRELSTAPREQLINLYMSLHQYDKAAEVMHSLDGVSADRLHCGRLSRIKDALNAKGFSLNGDVWKERQVSAKRAQTLQSVFYNRFIDGDVTSFANLDPDFDD